MMFMQSTLKDSKTRPNRRKTESGRRGLREIISGGSDVGSNRNGKRSAKGAPVSHGRPASNGSAHRGKRASGSSRWSGTNGAPVSHGKPLSSGGTTAEKSRQSTGSTWSFKRGGAATSHGKRTSRAGKKTRRGSTTNGTPPSNHGRRKKQERSPSIQLPSFAPWKLILGTVLAGCFGLLYITHVFSTQKLLEDVQVLEQEMNRLTRIHAERRLEYDRMIGPKEIYQRAQERGFVNAGPADQAIKLKR